MLTETKVKQKNQIVAGVMPWDDNIEFVGVAETQEVIWLRYGNTHYFKDLPDAIYRQLEEKYLNDRPAVQYISGITDDLQRQVELYTFFLYGDIDTIPDWSDGVLGESENIHFGSDCPSIDFEEKNITINGENISRKELRIIEMMRNEMTDEAIASELGIHLQTFYYHKKKLFKKAGVMTRSGLMVELQKNRL